MQADYLRYDRVTMLFHWLTALIVVGQWVGGQTIDWFPRGPLRTDARSVHIVAGTLLAAILVARIAWRLTRGRRLPPADTGALNLVAKGTHWGLYAMLSAMVGIGLFLTWVRGDSIFGLFNVPQFRPGDRALRGMLLDWHATLANVILAVAGLHAAAALAHRYVWKDGVLARMLPR